MKKILSFALSLAIILSALVLSPVNALAVDDPGTLDSKLIEFWADPENTITQDDITAFKNGDKTTMVGAVAVHKRSGSSSNYYLFLPSNADCNNLKLWFTASSASVDGVAVSNGETSNVFSDIDAGGVRKTYTINLGGTSYTVTALKSGDVGAVYIDTQSGTIANINNSSDKSVSESGTIMVTEPDGTVDFDGVMDKMKGRGNATWSAKGTKNPYNIKIAKKTALLGMAKSKKWCLLANAEDETLIKNQLTYDFSEYIGLRYQVIGKPVDLYVNQQYLGAYLLTEKVEIGSGRIEVSDAYENLENANAYTDPSTGEVITDLEGRDVSAVKEYKDENGTAASSDTLSADKNAQQVGMRRYSPSLVSPNDITGGYLYELEISNRWEGEGAGFCGYNRQGWVVKSCDFASKEMVNYSYDLFYALGGSVYNGGVVPNTSVTTNCSGLSALSVITNGARSITNPAPKAQYQGKKWDELLDSDSAVRYYWTQEYFKNMDSSTSSTYFYKDSDSVDGKLYAGPVWDMDASLGFDKSGSRWGYSYTSYDGWYAKNTRIYRWRANDSTTTYSSDNQSPRTFYGALATNCSDFWDRAGVYWQSRVSPASKILTGEAQDESGTLHSVSYYANKVAKSGTMNNLRHNLDNDAEYDAAGIITDMTAWLSNRAGWIDSQFSSISINDGDVTVEPVEEQYFNGSAKEPKISVSYKGIELEEDVDFTVEYSNNINPTNSALAVLTGKGAFTGTRNVNFVINKGTLSGASVAIDETACAGDVLSVSVTAADKTQINDYITYQWYADSVAIPNATGSEYEVGAGNVNKTVTVTVTGDGVNYEATSVVSNNCEISHLIKNEVIASWNYDYTADSSALQNADATGETYYYTANGGTQSGTAKLTGSVTAQTSSELIWSGSDLYVNDSTVNSPDQTPTVAPDKTALIAWGNLPYFETEISAIGYTDIRISAKLGGSKKGPRDYKVQYSLDGSTYTDVEGASYSITTNKTMEQAFTRVQLPAECNGKSKIYIRIAVENDIAINGTNVIAGEVSGNAAINNVVIIGNQADVQKYTVKFVDYSGTTVSEEEYPEGTAADSIAVPGNTAVSFDESVHTKYTWGTISDVTADAVYNESADTKPHSLSVTSSSEASCTQNGETVYSCSGCEYVKTDITPSFGHDFTGAVDVIWNGGSGTGENKWSASAVQHCKNDDSHTTDINVITEYSHKDATNKEAGYDRWEAKYGGEVLDTKNEVISPAGVSITVASTDLGTVEGSIETNGSLVTKVFEYGTKYTVTAIRPEGTTFLGWQINGKLVSTTDTYSSVAYTDLTLVPDKYGNTIKAFKDISVSEYQTAVADAVPAAPAYPGYTFTGYNKSDAEIKSNTASATYTARYEKSDITYTVTAPGADITVSAGTVDGDTATVPYDTKVTLKSAGAAGWAINNVTVAYGDKYTFFVGASVTVTPIDDAEVAPIVNIINVTPNAPNYTVLATRASGSAKITQRGWMYGRNASDEALADLESAQADSQVRVKIAAASDGANEFALTFKASQSGIIRVRAFIVDSDGEVYYSPTETINV